MRTVYPQIAALLDDLALEVDAIEPARRGTLEGLAAYVRAQVERDESVRLTFICTHNSRRSHLAQVWAQVAAAYHGVPGIETFSGGTEATAFEPRAVAALHRHGLRIEKEPGSDNPLYHVRYAEGAPAIEAFSKVYDQPPNPTEDFVAVMTCSHADDNCPFVPGALRRVSIPYDDPKAADGAPDESEVYDARCRQIAAEMSYLMSKVRV